MGRHHATAARRAVQPTWWRPSRSPSGWRWAWGTALDVTVRVVRQVWWWSLPVRVILLVAVVAVVLSVVGAVLGSLRLP